MLKLEALSKSFLMQTYRILKIGEGPFNITQNKGMTIYVYNLFMRKENIYN